MGTFKNMVCRGTFYYLCGVQDQRAWNKLMLASLDVSSQILLDDIWFWVSERAKHHGCRRPGLKNCWEVMRCGHGGGKCRASSEPALHGIHGGQNAGRACWGLPRTLCRDRDKDKCRECTFQKQVRREQLDYILDEVALKELLLRRW
jgi:hypothetical protein